MNNAQQTARVGLFFLLGLALVWVTFETLSDGKLFKDRGYTVIAGFDDLRQLKVGDEIRMAGVKIGSVEQTRLAGRRAEAVLRIDPSVQIASDASATIVMSGLIGSNYIGIDLGTPTAAPLQPGAEIHTSVTPDINAIMTQLGNLGSKFDNALGTIGEALKGKDGQPGLFQRLNTLVSDNGDKITATVSNLQEVTAKLNKGEGTMGKLINDPKLHDDLVATVGEIKSAATQAKTFVADAQAIIDQVKSGKGPLGTLVYDETTANDLKASVKNVRDVSDKLARGEGTLGKLINDDSLFRDAQGTLKKADRALDGLDDAGPINALGTVAKSLF
jgi:phospholipid/cholesterol/gamma-HCH transport system substrate-binding protein